MYFLHRCEQIKSYLIAVNHSKKLLLHFSTKFQFKRLLAWPLLFFYINANQSNQADIHPHMQLLKRLTFFLDFAENCKAYAKIVNKIR